MTRTTRASRGDHAPTTPTDQSLPSMSRRLDARLDRIGIRGIPARDAAGALVLALASVAVLYPLIGPLAGSLGLAPAGNGERALILGLVAAQALTLAVRRTLPVTCLAVVAAFQVALIAVLPADVSVYGAAPLVAAYTVGTRVAPRRLAWAAGSVLVLQAIAVALALAFVHPVLRAGLRAPAGTPGPPLGLSDLALPAIATILLGVAAAASGAWMALRREQVAAAQSRLAADVEEQKVRADAAAAAERSRIARELHDIAAHHLSGLVVQASAAERLVDADPEAAKETIRSVRAQGRRTLDNLRTAVGVLRDSGALADTGPDDGGAPVPGLSVLAVLVQDARAAGDTLEVRIDGEPRELSPIADISAYRIIQEGIANARRHAPGTPVEVTVRYDAHSVAIDVVNGPCSTAASSSVRGGGFGIVGMRERTAMLGGALEAGPTPDGGWRTHARLPDSRPAVDAS